VAGKIIAYLPGAPSFFSDGPGALYADSAGKRETAAGHGAVAVLSLSRPDDSSNWAETANWAKHGVMRVAEMGETTSSLRIPFLASLGPTGVEGLFEGEWNRLGEAIAEIKAGRPHSFLLAREVSVTQRSERSALESANVIGTLRGSDPKLQHEYVVYTAHLDHLGIGEPVNGDSIYNGARDNASGVAGLLAVARAFAQLPRSPRRSVVFVATTAEEAGLLGSQYFVDHPPVALRDIIAEINLDGLALFWPLRDVAGWGAGHSSLRAAVEAAAARLGLEATIPEKDAAVMVKAGDQAPFARNGVPAVWVVYGHKTSDTAVDAQALERKWSRHHQPSDDMDKPFNFDSSAKLGQAAFLTGLIAANEISRPTWNPGDYFGEKFGARRRDRDMPNSH
jgi:acetylornithine deacetylase/succinyl-diaminopimelate desuccinylase-like protein